MNEIELIARNQLFPYWIIYALLFSIAIISILKFQKEFVFVHLKDAFFKAPSSVPFSKGEISFFGATNWILLINYFAVSGITVYMLLVYFKVGHSWMVILPMAYYFYQSFALFIAGTLSGELKKLKDLFLLLNFTTHSIGIVMIPILFIWILNPELSTYLPKTLTVVFLLFHFIRIVRSIFIALKNKVLWYYIILYLCGLEIWPILAVYLLVSPGFIG
ncbi:DUF4271 domain-containing protein [Brumimicrobium sp.]|uniref:DUF4271 domain-containing protein n=1 Tax=Brumimicrobium sp. TaxID=2029867 RepID=UPI003A916A78